MDVRTHTNPGFLVLVFFSIAVATNAIPQARRLGVFYVRMETGKCSQTTLRLELDGFKPMPSSVLLRITRHTDDAVVVKQEVNLADDNSYRWTGLLAPLGKYKAELFDAKNRSAALGAPFAFNNIDILKDFIKEERGEITYISRGGKEPNNNQGDERKPLTVTRLPAPTGHNQIHIVVINDFGIEADEYYGLPPAEQRWSSKPLRPGRYRLVVAEYDKDNCHLVRSG
jgi:hypothetical protein